MSKDVIKKSNVTKVLKFLMLGIVLFILVYIFDGISEKTYETTRLETIQIGSQVIEYLDKYRSANKRYPESLEQLSKIPQPKWGKGWMYKCSKDGQSYELLTGHKKKDNSYGPALYYESGEGSSEWTYLDHDDSIEIK